MRPSDAAAAPAALSGPQASLRNGGAGPDYPRKPSRLPELSSGVLDAFRSPWVRSPPHSASQTRPCSTHASAARKGKVGGRILGTEVFGVFCLRPPTRNCCEGCANRLRQGLGWASPFPQGSEMRTGDGGVGSLLESLGPKTAPQPLPHYTCSTQQSGPALWTLFTWGQSGAYSSFHRPRKHEGLSDPMISHPWLRRPLSLLVWDDLNPTLGLQLPAGFSSSSWVLNGP